MSVYSPQAVCDAMAQYIDDDKLLVQTFLRSLIRRALAWFTKSEMVYKVGALGLTVRGTI